MTSSSTKNATRLADNTNGQQQQKGPAVVSKKPTNILQGLSNPAVLGALGGTAGNGSMVIVEDGRSKGVSSRSLLSMGNSNRSLPSNPNSSRRILGHAAAKSNSSRSVLGRAKGKESSSRSLGGKSASSRFLPESSSKMDPSKPSKDGRVALKPTSQVGWCLIFLLGSIIIPLKHVDALASPQPSVSRRDILPAIVFTAATLASAPTNAFENHVADYAKYTEKNKRRGTPPKDLGMRPRTTEGEDDTIIEVGLRSCDGNPNCFSTTGDYLLTDRQQYGCDYFIPKWIAPKDDNKPFDTLKQVVKAYEPGQGGIDGGGFGVIQETDSYIYLQFESLKKGFLDDVEFALDPKGEGVLVRSASRLGFTDFGVNAVRLNYIAEQLRAKGWTIPAITTKTHPDYWGAADAARGETFDEDRRKMAGAIE